MSRTRVFALVVLALSALAAAGIPRLSSSSHYSVYFDRADPALLSHQRIAAEFGRGESMLVLLEHADGDFLSADGWFLLESLTGALRQIDAVNSVIAASELNIDGVIETPSGQLIPDRAALVHHGRVFGLLLSDDARLAALLVDADLADYRAETVLSLNNSIRGVVEGITTDEAVTATYTGTLALSAAYVDVVRSDLRIIMPLLLVSMGALLFVLLGNIRAVLATLAIGLLAAIAAFGIAGWLGATLAAINTFAPIMILSISVAGCVHLILAYERARLTGETPQTAAIEARRQVLAPMTIANGTTILGFLALLLSPSPPLRIVGYTVAAGTAVSWLACIAVLPGLLARIDPARSVALAMAVSLRRVSKRAVRHSGLVLGTLAVLAIASVILLTRNSVSDNVLEYFPSEHPFATGTRVAEQELAGVNEIVYQLDGPGPDALLEASTVRAIEGFTGWLREQPEVRQVSSLLDLDLMREALESDRLQPFLDRLRGRTPTATEHRELTADRSGLLVSVYLERLDSHGIVDFDRRVHDAARERLQDFVVTSGGAPLIFARLGEANIRSMLVALSGGLALAALLFGLALRSVTVGIVGLACNVLPVMAVYGVWAVLNGSISLGAATVMGMILGIVIDDTVYLLTAWWRQRQHADAAVRAVADIGPALVTTTAVLAVGLSAGLLSDFMPVWSMSALSVGIILTALLVDLVGLPALLERINA